MKYQFYKILYRKCRFSSDSIMQDEKFAEKAAAITSLLNENNFMKKIGYTSKMQKFPKKMYSKMVTVQYPISQK